MANGERSPHSTVEKNSVIDPGAEPESVRRPPDHDIRWKRSPNKMYTNSSPAGRGKLLVGSRTSFLRAGSPENSNTLSSLRSPLTFRRPTKGCDEKGGISTSNRPGLPLRIVPFTDSNVWA